MLIHRHARAVSGLSRGNNLARYFSAYANTTFARTTFLIKQEYQLYTTFAIMPAIINPAWHGKPTLEPPRRSGPDSEKFDIDIKHWRSVRNTHPPRLMLFLSARARPFDWWPQHTGLRPGRSRGHGSLGCSSQAAVVTYICGQQKRARRTMCNKWILSVREYTIIDVLVAVRLCAV